MTQELETTSRDEARQELTAMLSGRLGAIPPDLVVEHLLTSYDLAEWPVLRESARALLRRAASVEREGLRVASRPSRGSWCGVYRTRRPRKPVRPYETCLMDLRPLRISCDCPDYQRGSLGLCKHGLVVLQAVASKPRRFVRALEGAGKSRVPGAFWYPIRALEGRGDWIEGVRVHAGADLPSKTRRLFEPAEDGWLRVAASRVGSEPARARLVETVAEIASSRRARDPALRALLKREQDERTRGGALRLPPSQVQRSLRGFHLSLYPYQLLAVEKFLGTGRMLLADDMGLGKTVQAAAIGHVLADTGKVRRTLVLAPASLKHQWVSEWRRATDVPIEPVEGTPEMRQHQYGAMSTGVLVANYEQVFRDLELMQGWGPELVILDEAQRIKNWATLTARQVKQLDVPYRLVLTGTPLENRLDELASIMDWVDPSVIAPKWRLGPAHSVLADGANEIVGVQRLDVLRTRLAPRMLRRRRAEVLSELPERTDTVRRVAMTPAQRIEHDDLCQPIAQLVQAARRRGLTQAQFLRLMSLLTTQRIIANGMAQLHFSHTWPGLHDRLPEEALMASLSMPKLDHIRELIESVVLDQHRKVVVFSQWRRALCLANWSISDILGRQGLRAAFFTGKESQRRRTQNVIEFHDDPALRVLFCSDAGGVGLNLQRAASCCINFELPWNPAVLEQRIGRIHRLGQSDPVDVYTLVSENSIEAKIASVVTDKRALFTGLFDGDTDEIQFDGAGSFLGAVQAVVDPGARPADSGGSDVDDVEPADDPRVDEVVSSGDERLDPPPAEARGAATLPPVDEVRQLFSQLRVNTRPDGGVVLEAPAEAAQTLGALFSGMAALLEQAAGPSASR